MSKRFDRAVLDKAMVTPQGFLRVPATMTRVGVFPYRKADGSIRREYRPAEEVFREDTLESMKGIPLTDDHPEDFVTAENARKHMRGYVGEVITRMDDHVHGNITVTDKELIEKIQSGKVEVSMGYTADEDFTPGTFNGQAYDLVQRNIKYNHVSSVNRGRAGATVRIRLDADDAELFDGEVPPQNKKQEPRMEKIIVDGVEQEVTPAFAAVHRAMIQKRDSELAAAKAEVTTAKKDIDAKTAKVDALEDEVKTLKAAKKDAADLDTPEMFLKKYGERRSVEKAAEQVLPKETKIDGLTNLDLMKEVVKVKTGKELTDKSEDYIKARFDHIVEGLETDKKKVDDINGAFAKRLDGAEEGTAKKAREKASEESRNAWKQ